MTPPKFTPWLACKDPDQVRQKLATSRQLVVFALLRER